MKRKKQPKQIYTHIHTIIRVSESIEGRDGKLNMCEETVKSLKLSDFVN